MKNILLIATGGTIASRPTSEGLAPGISSGELAACVPEISALCRLEAMQLFNLDSTNMNPKHWLQLAAAIEAHYGDYDGFVVTHGTDTMAYAAATLSYLIQNSPKPIVLTGAQRTIYDRDSDARQNLADAVRYAADDRAGGVTLVFDGQVITGTRARKMRTKSFNAFSSIDFPPLAVLRSGALHLYIPHRPAGPVRFFHRLDPSVFVLKLIPGMQADIFDYLANNCHAVIIESFGVGGIPYYDSDEFADKIALLVRRGVKVIVTTQVPHEGSDMEVYSVGLRIKKRYELLEAYDMTGESVYAKTMWALAHSSDEDGFRRLFLTPVYMDIV